MTDDFTEIPVPGLPWLTHVRLYDETWQHILLHPEFQKIEGAARQQLEQAIANPVVIHESTSDPTRSVVYFSNSLTYLGNPVVVPVRRVTETSGRVVTAYFSESYSGQRLWSTGDD